MFISTVNISFYLNSCQVCSLSCSLFMIVFITLCDNFRILFNFMYTWILANYIFECHDSLFDIIHIISISLSLFSTFPLLNVNIAYFIHYFYYFFSFFSSLFFFFFCVSHFFNFFFLPILQIFFNEFFIFRISITIFECFWCLFCHQHSSYNRKNWYCTVRIFTCSNDRISLGTKKTKTFTWKFFSWIFFKLFYTNKKNGNSTK